MTQECRVYTYRSGARLMGRSYIYITCPFCGAEVRAYIWSLAGSGKKCPNCGALHVWLGSRSYRKSPAVALREDQECQE